MYHQGTIHASGPAALGLILGVSAQSVERDNQLNPNSTKPKDSVNPVVHASKYSKKKYGAC